MLGHHTANQSWRDFIDQATLIKVNDDIIDQVILIRKKHKIKIPDAIIAATAVVHHLILITRNVDDFKNIDGLKIENPWQWKANH